MEEVLVRLLLQLPGGDLQPSRRLKEVPAVDEGLYALWVPVTG
jgi:hypothetical protein